MKCINNLLNNHTFLLSVIIGICIVIVAAILISRLQNEKMITVELKKITDSIRAGLVHFILEDDCRILYASKGFYDILGYNKDEIQKLNKSSLLDFLDKRNLSFVEEIKNKLEKDTIHSEISLITKDGVVLPMLMDGNISLGRDGKHTFSVVFVDFSEQKRMQELILLEGERYRIATELSNDILFEYHIESDEMRYSEKYREFFGINPVIINFKDDFANHRDLVHPDDWGIYLEFCYQLTLGISNIDAEFRFKNRLGEFIWCQLMGRTIYDDKKNPLRIIGKIVNIDSQKRELEALEYKATRDPLTGVYNKEITSKKIEKFISGNKKSRHMLMLIDFDNFKSVNDNYGHLVGDKVLIFVISCIKEVFTEGEIIGRIGGDEFVVFSGNIENDEEVLEKAALLKESLDTNYISDKLSIPITSSIGVVIYPESGLHYEQLMEYADQALYNVKEHGKNNYLLYRS